MADHQHPYHSQSLVVTQVQAQCVETFPRPTSRAGSVGQQCPWSDLTGAA